MAESEEEQKSFLMKGQEESEKVALKLSFQKTKIMASGPITSWEIDGETVETVKWSEITQSCLTLWDPVDCRLPGFSIHGIFQTRVLEWVAIYLIKCLLNEQKNVGRPVD